MDDSSSSAAAMSESSYQQLPTQPSSSSDEVDSLPSSSASSTSVSPSEEDSYNDAEREWRESLQQLELLLTMVLVPYLGKYFGRKAAYWGGDFAVMFNATMLMYYRLGQIHGMAVSGQRGDHKSWHLQSRGRHRGSRIAVKDLPIIRCNKTGTMWQANGHVASDI